MITTRARGRTRLTTYHYLIYEDVLQEAERTRGVLSRAQALWQHSYDRYQAHRCPECVARCRLADARYKAADSSACGCL